MTATPYVSSNHSSAAAQSQNAAKKPASDAVRDLLDFINQLNAAQKAKAKEADADKTAAGKNDTAKSAGMNDIAKLLNGIEPGGAGADTQGLDQNVLAKLEGKFSALTQDGATLDDDTLAQFKAAALKLLKDLGISGDDAQKYLAALTRHLGSNITNAQAAFLSPPQNDGLPDDAQNALDSASAAQDIAGKSLQQAANGKPGVGGLQSDKTNNGLPRQDPSQQAPQQQPAPQQDAQAVQKPLPQLSAGHGGGADGGGTQNDAGAGGSGSNSGGGHNGSAFNGGDTLTTPTPGGGVQVSTSGGTQNFSNILSQTQAAPQVPQMVAVQIQRNLAANINTFTMRLDPAELGSLEIRMKFAKDGSVKTHLIADKPETLSMLKHDAGALSRLLQQSGLNADEGSLSFEMRQDQQGGNDDSYGASGAGGARSRAAAPADNNTIQANIAVEAMGHISQDGVNIMV